METLSIQLKGANFKTNLAIVKTCDGRRWNGLRKRWLIPATLENLKLLSTIPSLKDEMLTRIEDMEIDIERELLRATVTPEGAFDLRNDYPFLMDHQCIGAHFILQKERYLLADSVGTGKTIQCLPYIDRMVKDGRKIIVLCPSSISHQWASEIERFINLPSTNIVGLTKHKRLTEYEDGLPIIITTYESFKNDIVTLKERKFDFSNVCIVADEASKIKNEDTQIYKQLRIISSEVHGFISLSATPLENSLDNFFNIISITVPNFMTRKEFEDKYCKFDGDKSKCSGYRNLKEFIHKIAGVMIRRTKEDVTELLPPVVQNRIIPLTKEQRMCMEGVQKYYNKTGNMGCVILLREIANDTSLLHASSSVVIQDMQKKGMLPLNIPQKSNKIPECLDIIEEIGNDKIIIFTQFTRMANKLGDVLTKKGYKIKVLTGDNSIPERNTEVERFKNGEYQILIATDIFGYGINLQFCHYMINFDIPWNPARLNQRVGRIHRIGSDETKTIINLLSEDIDEHVYEVVKGKQNLFDMVIEGKAIDDETIRKQILQKLVE